MVEIGTGNDISMFSSQFHENNSPQKRCDSAQAAEKYIRPPILSQNVAMKDKNEESLIEYSDFEESAAR